MRACARGAACAAGRCADTAGGGGRQGAPARRGASILAVDRLLPHLPHCDFACLPLASRSAPIVASQLLLVDEVLRAGMNMRRGAA